MAAPFDANQVVERGWRQGAVLGPALWARARECAPGGLDIPEGAWLIVTSHDCDIANFKLENEPTVEVLVGVPAGQKRPDKQQTSGRNPRRLQFDFETREGPLVIACKAHERWPIPRDFLVEEVPALVLPPKLGRLIAEWLAKRYIRAAFPTAFDGRWRSKLSLWTAVLAAHSQAIQGVYLRLNKLDELPPEQPYRCLIIVAVPAKIRRAPGWAKRRAEIGDAVTAFWKQFQPGILLDEVEVLGTDELTLEAISKFQRFDADWVSFEDESPTTPIEADMPG